jgi:hypothetical protein
MTRILLALLLLSSPALGDERKDKTPELSATEVLDAMLAPTLIRPGQIASAAKGDVMCGITGGTFSLLTAGANNTVLTADSTQTCGFKWSTAGSGTVTGTGSTGKIPKWSSSTALTDSLAADSGTKFTYGAGGGTPAQSYDGIISNVAGVTQITALNATNSVQIGMFAHSATGYFGTWTNHPIIIRTNNTDAVTIAAVGTVTFLANGRHIVGGGGTTSSTALRIDGGSGTGIGSYTSFAKNGTDQASIGNASVILGSGTASDLALFAQSGNAIDFYTNGSTSARWGINITGDLTFGASKHIYLSAGSPTLTTCTNCGAGATITGTDNDFVIYAPNATGGNLTITVTFGHTFSSTPICRGVYPGGGQASIFPITSTTAITSLVTNPSYPGIYMDFSCGSQG